MSEKLVENCKKNDRKSANKLSSRKCSLKWAEEVVLEIERVWGKKNVQQVIKKVFDIKDLFIINSLTKTFNKLFLNGQRNYKVAKGSFW